MRVSPLIVTILLPLGFSCGRPAKARPASVPASAVLLTSSASPAESVWVSCTPDPALPRRFSCTSFEALTGRILSSRRFRLVQGDDAGNPMRPPDRFSPSLRPAPVTSPSSLQLRTFDGTFLFVQPPWFLAPEPTPPVQTDPPESRIPPLTDRPA